MIGPTASGLRIDAVRDLGAAADISELFRRTGLEVVARSFEQTYRRVYEGGGCSWVARDATGQAVMHIAHHPRAFHLGTSSWRAGLLGDLVADETHRDFWSPVTLLRRVVGDLRARGTVDFVYTDPTPQAVAVVVAAGIKPMARMRRFILPLPRLARAAIRMARRSRKRPRVAIVEQPPADVVAAALRTRPANLFCAERDGSLYHRRAATGVRGDVVTLGISVPGSNAPSGGICYVHLDDAENRTAVLADLRWSEAVAAPEAALDAVADWALRRRVRRLSTSTVEGSEFEAVLRRAAAIPRHHRQPIHALALRASVTLPPPSQWLLLPVDGSNW